MKKILIWVSDESLKKVSMVVNEVNSDICILSVKTQKEANSVIINNDVDLFIIEINSNNDSFEFAKDVRKQRAYRFIPGVIMAENEKLICQAYEIVRCYAFMKKPYDMEGLKEILKKLNNYKFVKRKSDKVKFKHNGVIYFFNKSEIKYIENSNRQVKIYSNDTVTNIGYKTCDSIIERLGCKDFVRCSRNGIVNAAHIVNISDEGIIEIKEFDKKIEIGSSIKKHFIQDLNELNILFNLDIYKVIR